MSYWQEAVGKRVALHYTEVTGGASPQTFTTLDRTGVVAGIVPLNDYEYVLRFEPDGDNGYLIMNTAGLDSGRGIHWFRTYMFAEE